MKIYILTLFPEIFTSVFSKSIINRALDKKIVTINFVNLRNWGEGKHKKVDDTPYGGGRGMVMKAEPVFKALKSIKPAPYTVLLCASGKKYTQKDAQKLSKKKNIALICGHYEGTDARIENYVDEIFSIGDFILTGGEIPAMVVADSVIRLIPGVINEKSALNESFSHNQNLLEYPQYTKPEIFNRLKVPKILLSGNHKEIEKWRQEQSLIRTRKFRPDLLKD